MGQQLQSLRWEEPGLWRTMWMIMKKQPVHEEEKLLKKLQQKESEAIDNISFNLKEMNQREEYNRYNVNRIKNWKPLSEMKDNLSQEGLRSRKFSEVLISHPWPIMQGPFNVPIGTMKGDGYCDYMGIVQTFRSWTTYQHTDKSPCQMWSVVPNTYPKNKLEMRRAVEEKWRWKISKGEEVDPEAKKLDDKRRMKSICCEEYDIDPPIEFECAITGDLMSDPIILPSGYIVGRQNIERSLLSTPKDLFNGDYLTKDMLKSDDNLRTKIDLWRIEHRKFAEEDKCESEVKKLAGPAQDRSTGVSV